MNNILNNCQHNKEDYFDTKYVKKSIPLIDSYSISINKLSLLGIFILKMFLQAMYMFFVYKKNEDFLKPVKYFFTDYQTPMEIYY